MVLTNAEVRPRPRPVSAITPDTPLHEVAINTWMCVERMVTPRQRRWRIGRAFCQRASPSPFSLEDPADTADSYACWTGENADEAAVGWTERVRQEPPFWKPAVNASGSTRTDCPSKRDLSASHGNPGSANRRPGEVLRRANTRCSKPAAAPRLHRTPQRNGSQSALQGLCAAKLRPGRRRGCSRPPPYPPGRSRGCSRPSPPRLNRLL